MKSSPLFVGLSALLSVSISQGAVNLTSGHMDLGLGEGSELELHIHDESTDTEYAPDEAVIVVPQSSYDFVDSNGGRPSGSAWDPIGVSAGENYWYLPASSGGSGGAADLNAPFLGVGGEEITLGAFDDNTLTLTLIGANMPDSGDFSLWVNGFTPTFFMSTADGISAADSITMDLASSDHQHFNWGFTEAGSYELEFTVTGYIEGVLQSDTGTYTFNVVPEPSAYAALAGTACLGLVLLRRRFRTRGSHAVGKPSI